MEHDEHSESQSNGGDVSSATAVLLGALAPGVNVCSLVPSLSLSQFHNIPRFTIFFILFYVSCFRDLHGIL